MTDRQHNTEIEWTHPPGFLGETWNPTSGCTKVSPACANCYAELLSRRFNLSPPFLPRQYRIDLHHDRLELPLRWGSIPRCIFVDSMSDLFHEDIPFDFIDKVMAAVFLCQQHIFQILTKRALRMREYFESNPLPRIKDEAYAFQTVKIRSGQKPWSERIKERIAEPGVWPFPNLWLGVSTENQEWLNRRLPILLEIPAVVHFISAEPLLGPIQCEAIPYPVNLPIDGGNLSAEMGLLNAYTGQWEYDRWKGNTGPLHWVIMGGESGPRVRLTHVQWFRDLRDACAKNDTPVFMKQWGSWGILDRDIASRIETMAKTDAIQFSKVQTGYKFHVRLADNRRALCRFEADLSEQTEQFGLLRPRRYWKTNTETKPPESELCWACLRILSPTIRYARLDPRDRSRQPSDLRRDTDIPMIRKGKTNAGNELDGHHHKQFPDLTYFGLANMIADAPKMPAGFIYSLPKHGNGTLFHIRPSDEDYAICGFTPKAPKAGSRNGNGSRRYWEETVTEEGLNGRQVCPKCIFQKKGTRWLYRYSTLTDTVTTKIPASVQAE